MITFEEKIILHRETTCSLLRELKIDIHRNGYRQLVILIPCFALDGNQRLSKELYPYVTELLGYTSWQAVERAVRIAIMAAWMHRNPSVWEKYFPDLRKPPSNKQFIATLAEQLKKAPPVSGRS